jgi:hypothetical protein
MEDSYIQSLMGEREKIILITRQHWFVLVKAVLLEGIIAVLILAAVVATFAIFQIGLIFLGLVLLFIPAVSFIKDVLDWTKREYIITTRRVMHISGIFSKNVIDSSLEKVNDVKLVQSFWGRIFNFGDVQILTASELGANFFNQIGDPVHFKTTMLNAKEKLGWDETPGAGRSSSVRVEQGGPEDIPGLIRELDKLRKLGILTEDEFQAKKRELLNRLR